MIFMIIISTQEGHPQSSHLCGLSTIQVILVTSVPGNLLIIRE